MPETAPDPGAIARWLALDPKELLRGCDQMPFQGPGPGGQKRNRVYSGVRLRHRESGLTAEASERREARRNLEDALRRLRMAMALALPPPRPESAAAPAAEIPPPPPEAPGAAVALSGEGGNPNATSRALPDGTSFRVDAGPSHEDYPRSVFAALLALASRGGRVSEAAADLGTGASALARLLRADKAAWARTQALRKAHGLPPLK